MMRMVCTTKQGEGGGFISHLWDLRLRFQFRISKKDGKMSHSPVSVAGKPHLHCCSLFPQLARNWFDANHGLDRRSIFHERHIGTLSVLWRCLTPVNWELAPSGAT